jgi:hypothetical protein
MVWLHVQSFDKIRWPYLPVPVSGMACGLLLALSLTFNVALRVPVACGLNVTEIVHLWQSSIHLLRQ